MRSLTEGSSVSMASEASVERLGTSCSCPTIPTSGGVGPGDNDVAPTATGGSGGGDAAEEGAGGVAGGLEVERRDEGTAATATASSSFNVRLSLTRSDNLLTVIKKKKNLRLSHLGGNFWQQRTLY